MIKNLLKECIEEGKEGYFKSDSHYYAGKYGKDADWKSVFNNEDVFFEWVLPVIKHKQPDLYELSTPESLYLFCKKIINGGTK